MGGQWGRNAGRHLGATESPSVPEVPQAVCKHVSKDGSTQLWAESSLQPSAKGPPSALSPGLCPAGSELCARAQGAHVARGMDLESRGHLLTEACPEPPAGARPAPCGAVLQAGASCRPGLHVLLRGGWDPTPGENAARGRTPGSQGAA